MTPAFQKTAGSIRLQRRHTQSKNSPSITPNARIALHIRLGTTTVLIAPEPISGTRISQARWIQFIPSANIISLSQITSLGIVTAVFAQKSSSGLFRSVGDTAASKEVDIAPNAFLIHGGRRIILSFACGFIRNQVR
jgi:hypothetical protein